MKTKVKIMVAFWPPPVFTVPVAAQTNEEAGVEKEFSDQMEDFVTNGAPVNQIRSFTSDLRRQNINSLHLQRLLACRAKLSAGSQIRGRRYNAGKSPPPLH